MMGKIIKAIMKSLMRLVLILLGILVTLGYIASIPVNLIVFIITGSKAVDIFMFSLVNRIYKLLENT